jgi:cation transport protein ChaC
VAFRATAAEAEATIRYLREREQVTAVYVERRLPVTLDDGRAVRAVGYIVDRRHPQYAGRLPEAELLRLVRQGRGISGANPDYVRSTHEHLLAMNVVDPTLAGLVRALDTPA